ncbi:PilZ domain-containing protein [Desulfobotulus alkaliphilus]|uniref:PilZ domain-containing protein n=1 Tax=Desulfobotulus alkaliphilus TaxID=622671 RepID=A0A562RHK7_9BACT|nr:PilZ domain-containing protein [Desulfobotulus alkaliphilus]TWI68602.1 PilZ domain-containing protein [Desulfobotulus alkaliphilus]
MFSKNKNNFFSWLDKALKDRRRSFRYAPQDSVRVYVRVGGEAENRLASDISAGGCSFNHPDLRPGDRFIVHMISHTPEVPLDLMPMAEVLGRTSDGQCHCSFPDIMEKEEEILHRFVLAAQRYEFQQRRRLKIMGLRKKKI